MPTLTGKYIHGDGTPRVGALRFSPSVTIVGDDTIILPTPFHVPLVDGEFTVTGMVACDDPAYAPTGWVWTVEERMTGGRTWSFELTGDADLADLTPVSTPDAYTIYATVGALTDHEAATTGVHGIVDTADLVTTDDARLSDDRTPTAHAASHAQAGADALDVADLGSGAATDGYVATADGAGGVAWEAVAGGVTSVNSETGAVVLDAADVGAAATVHAHTLADVSDSGGAAALEVGTTAGTVAAGNDARLSDARTPTAHAATHAAAGSDPVTVAESQVTGLTAALAAKAPLASPALTGTPTAPTAAQGTNTTQVATTAHVATEVGLLVPKSLYDANTILAATSNDTPAALAVPASTLVGRGAAGNIAALSVADVRTLVGTTRVTRPLTDDLKVEVYDATLGWVVTKYDSGWRTLVSTSGGAVISGAFGSANWGAHATNPGYVRVRRVNDQVFYSCVWVEAKAATPTTAIVSAAAGFRWTDSGSNAMGLVQNTNPNIFSATASGLTRLSGTCALADCIGRVGPVLLQGMTTETIPTALPGVLYTAAPLA